MFSFVYKSFAQVNIAGKVLVILKYTFQFSPYILIIYSHKSWNEISWHMIKTTKTG